MYVLVDGAILAYSAFYKCTQDGLDVTGDYETEVEHYYPFFVSSFARPFVNINRLITRNLRPNYIKTAIVWEGAKSSEPRRRVFPEYKMHRAANKKEDQTIFPHHFIELFLEDMEAIGSRYALRFNLLEGDDLVAFICQKLTQRKGTQVCVVSADNDFLQLVRGNVFFMKATKGKYEIITPGNALEKTGIDPKNVVEYKALVGDSSDGYKGVKGVGPKKANEYFNTVSPIMSSYRNDAGYKQGMLLAQLPFPKIYDHEDFDIKSFKTFIDEMDFNSIPNWYIIEDFITDEFTANALRGIV